MTTPSNLNISNTTGSLLRSQVYEYLRHELKEGKLKPGIFVSINQIMKNLDLSRTPLRDALLQLQTEGFVTFLPQRGIRINELSQQDIEDMYEMLGALDSRVLLSVFPRIGTPEIKKMKRLNQQMLGKISDSNFSRYWDINTAFHRIVINEPNGHVGTVHLPSHVPYNLLSCITGTDNEGSFGTLTVPAATGLSVKPFGTPE